MDLTGRIDKAVAWSRTDHGGFQFDMFAPGAGEDGCMRWGMCETPAKED